MLEITRKCDECKEAVNLLNGEFLITGNKLKKFFHRDCYINSRNKRFKSKKAIENFHNKVVELEKDAELFVKENLDKDRFYKWIYSNYNVCALAKHIFIRIADINSGCYKGLTEAITYEDLLDMFKRKKKELDTIAHNKERKGNGFGDNVNSRILYDLAVIVAKYDSYKAWKEKQKVYEVTAEIEKQESKIDYSKINMAKQNDHANSVDLGDIFEDIY